MSEFRKIVECELAKHGYSLEEDAYKDRENLLLALNTYEEIVKTCKEEIDSLNMYSKHESLNVGADYIENITLFKLKSLKPELTVCFVVDLYENNKTRGEFDVESNTIYIYMNSIYSDLETVIESGKEYPNAVVSTDDWFSLIRSKLCQDTFVHEFQHYLDNKRGIINNSVKKISNKKKSKEIDYWNDPIETNAFYMQRLMNAANDLSKKYNKALRDMTPEERLDFIKNSWKNNRTFMLYYNKLEPKAQKRLLSRLYQYFSTDFWK